MYDKVQNTPLRSDSNLFKLQKSLGAVYLYEQLKNRFLIFLGES